MTVAVSWSLYNCQECGYTGYLLPDTVVNTVPDGIWMKHKPVPCYIWADWFWCVLHLQMVHVLPKRRSFHWGPSCCSFSSSSSSRLVHGSLFFRWTSFLQLGHPFVSPPTPLILRTCEYTSQFPDRKLYISVRFNIQALNIFYCKQSFKLTKASW